MWKSRLGILWLVIVIVVVLVSFGIRMVYSGKYDKNLGLNMILIGDSKIGVIGLRGETDLVNMVVLPSDLVVESGSGKGRYLIGSLWGLGKLDNNPGEEVMLSLSKSLGFKITGFVKVSDEDVSVMSISRLMSDWRVVTNLNLWDRVQIIRLVKKLYDQGTLVSKNVPSNLMREEVEPDGLKVKVFDRDRVYSWSAREWVNPAILKERVNVAVFNNSDEPGKALIWGRMLETVGVRVVVVEKGEKKTNGCKYRLFREDLVEVVKMIEKDFGCSEGGFESIYGPGRVDIEIMTG